MNIDPFNFADALLGIMAQRLIRTLCAKCKEAYTQSREEFDEIAEAYGREWFRFRTHRKPVCLSQRWSKRRLAWNFASSAAS